jgi:hypothetical protein
MAYRSEIGVSGIATAITPSDSANIAPARLIYVGTGGTLNITPQFQTTVVLLRNVPSGSFLPIAVSKISNTNTTASNIVAFQ